MWSRLYLTVLIALPELSRTAIVCMSPAILSIRIFDVRVGRVCLSIRMCVKTA